MATTLNPPTLDSLTVLTKLATLVSQEPQAFLRPSFDVQQTALAAAKCLLDPLATSVNHAQVIRRNENRKKRKRGDHGEESPVLQIRQVYTKGFGVKQVWEQAKRILDAAQQEVERGIQLHQSFIDGVHEETKSHDPQRDRQNGVSSSDSEFDKVESEDDDHDLNEGLDGRMFDEDAEDASDGEGSNSGPEEEEEDIEMDSDLDESDEKSRQEKTYISDPNGLNDGFFSIDDFNRHSQFLEQMDARGDNDNPSDEDEIDWDVDPLAVASSGRQRKPVTSMEEDGDESDEEGGPTFGDADPNAAEDEDEDVLDDEELENVGDISNANEIRYTDFFEPPPKKPSKSKRTRALPKTQPPPNPKKAANESSEDEERQLQDDLERAMADVRRDLLDSDEEDLSDEEDDDDDPNGSRAPGAKTKQTDKGMSTHEKQRAAIALEIRRLEAANVAKRDWQLSGEARAADRPVNSLVEEDLEFERAGKPIAPVTAETADEIDALIKRRILAREFDEVVRRVPGSLNFANETRRGRIELDDTKPQASLGEIYEAEHQKNADPLSYVDKRSAATKKAHAAIDILWKQVRDQLDLLSNMHFKPKRVEVEIKTVEDKPRIAMEDARPVGEIESGEGGMLAPQEVYRPGIDSRGTGQDEVMLAGGAALSRREMSREEKLRRRRREKERSKKAKTNGEVSVLGKTKPEEKVGRDRKGKEADKANIIDDLKKGGVKVVGKGGELQSLGKQKRGRTEGTEVIASNLKL